MVKAEVPGLALAAAMGKQGGRMAVMEHCCGAINNLLTQLPEAEGKALARDAPLKAALEAAQKASGGEAEAAVSDSAKSALEKAAKLAEAEVLV